MAHKASKISQKYLEMYLKERGVPLHNERVGELFQLNDGAEILQLPVLQIPDNVDDTRPKLWTGACYPNPRSSPPVSGR